MGINLDIEDHASLVDWLRASGRIEREEQPRVETLTGGVSNRTVLVQRVGTDGDAWVIKQGLEKLRVQADWFCDPARVHREAAGLRWLAKLLPAGSVPGFVGEDFESHLLIMQAVPQPHDNWKSLLLAGHVDRDHCRQFGAMLGTIHRRAFERRDEIRLIFDDRTFFETLRLEPYYSYTAAQEPEVAEFIRRLLAETRDRCLTLVHGDFSPKNILVYHGQLVLLDDEVIHWGDPAFDVGFGLTHLLSKAHHLPAYRAVFAKAARRVWQSYQDEIDGLPWQTGLEHHVVRHTLGCLLARVVGRSPLEYLTEQQRAVQRREVIGLMDAAPESVDALIESFIKKV